MRSIILIAHDIRSTHNIGSLLRTADGLGVEKVYITGYSPYPKMPNDSRLPHVAEKQEKSIQKTALDAQHSVDWEYVEDINIVISRLSPSYTLIALEQTESAIDLNKLKAPKYCALLLGNEVAGIKPELLKLCPVHVVIPMFGKKESFNVVQAAAMALYQLKFF